MARQTVADRLGAGFHLLILGLVAVALVLMASLSAGEARDLAAPESQAFREQGYAVGFVRTTFYSCASVDQMLPERAEEP